MSTLQQGKLYPLADRQVWNMKKARIMRMARFILLLLISAVVSTDSYSWSPRGLDPARDISQYAHRAWTKREGLPQNSVQAITQTADGYLWLGTMEGLARFDGTMFRVFNVRNTPDIKSQLVSALLTDDRNRLWIGTNGGGLTMMENGTFHLVKHKELLQSAVVSLYNDSRGIVWAATNVGLISIEGDSVTRIYSRVDGLPYKGVFSITEDFDGRILVATGGGVFVLDGDCFRPFEPLKVVDDMPMCLAVDSARKEYWVGTYKGNVWRIGEGDHEVYTEKDGLPRAAVVRLFKDERGAVWVGSSMTGLYRIYDGLVSCYSSADGLSGDQVSSLYEDREGNLWVGVATGGVNCFVNSKFTTYKIGRSPAENMIWTLSQDSKGMIVAGNAAGQVFSFTGKAFAPIKELKEPLPRYATSFLRDKDGALWIGSGVGLWKAHRGPARLVAKLHVLAILQDSEKRMWIGTSQGLRLMRGNTPVKIDLGYSNENVDIRILYEDSHANLWIGTRGFGLLRAALPQQQTGPLNTLKAERVHFQQGETARTGWISSVNEDEEGTIWVTTYGGTIVAFTGDTTEVVDCSRGVPEEALHTALDDRQGNLWVSSNNGIYRIRKSDIRAVASGALAVLPYAAFSSSDGMASDECNGGFQSCGVRSRDGKLWFPTVQGVVMVDPTALPYNDVPPAMAIEAVKIDHQDVTLESSPAQPPGNGDMVFQYAGLCFSGPHTVRYKYMLEGFNTDWVDAGFRREAFYTNIPPGSYTFRVKAQNGDGVWNEAGAAFAFSLRPHFQQTIWFYLLVGGMLVLLAAGGLHLYRRDRDRELQASQLESQLAQAQLQVLEMQLQPHFLFNTLNGIMVLIREDPEKARKMIARLSELLRMSLDGSGEQEVPLRKELEFLDRYVQIEMIRFEDRLAVEQHIRHGLEDALVPHMILQPLVENAIRHGLSKRRSHAMIEIDAARENGSLTIHVRDNGSGLPGNKGNFVKEGIGLSNIRARLHHLYGANHAFELTSPEEGGVDVRLTIPWREQAEA